MCRIDEARLQGFGGHHENSPTSSGIPIRR